MEDARRHHLRAGFGQSAADYQPTRPACPPQLFDDLVRLRRLGPGDRVLEIGCGTGQATVPLARRGLAVTAVELSESLAALARQRLAGVPATEMVTSSFEDWQPGDARFAAVVASARCTGSTRRPGTRNRPACCQPTASSRWPAASGRSPRTLTGLGGGAGGLSGGRV